MTTDYGSDIVAIPDLDPTFSPVTGPRVVAQAIARRLSTPRGSLPFYPNYGIDVRDYLNERITVGSLAQIRRDVESECMADERVRSADVSAAHNTETGEMRLTVSGTTLDGPFSLVLGVSAVSVTLLSVTG